MDNKIAGELDSLIATTNLANYQTDEGTSLPNKTSTNTMHTPQYVHEDGDMPAAVATRGSRQLFYRDMSMSESRDFNNNNSEMNIMPAATPTTPQINRLPAAAGTNSSDLDSTDSEPLDGQLGVMTELPQPQGLPPPRQLYENYSHRLHRNQVAQGHHNFVVGGAHGRYRDYGGTLIEVPEEVYAVRKAALTVLDPITYCWVSLLFSNGTTVLSPRSFAHSTLPFLMLYFTPQYSLLMNP